MSLVDCSSPGAAMTQYCQNQRNAQSGASLAQATAGFYENSGHIMAIIWLIIYLLITGAGGYFYFKHMPDADKDVDDNRYATGFFISGIFAIICGLIGTFKSYGGTTDAEKKSAREVGAWIATIPIIVIIVIFCILSMISVKRV